MLKKVLIGLGIVVGLLVVFLIYVATLPNDYKVERSLAMAAPPEVVFAQVNDFHHWNDWSPWAKLDPNCKYEYEGAEAGEGAVFKWSGDDKVGEGSMKILESKPNESLKIDLRFVRPMEDRCDTFLSFQPQGENTLVTWTMSGAQPNFVGKVFCYLMNMEKMIGVDFEKGLASMKTAAEKQAKSPAIKEETPAVEASAKDAP